MTEHARALGEEEVAAVVAEAFASREPLVSGLAAGLPDAVRRRVARRRRGVTTAIGGLAAVAVVLAVAIPLTLAQDGGSGGGSVAAPGPNGAGPGRPGPAIPPPTGDPPVEPGPGAGWRIESSLGVEIDVPADWGTNDFGCNMTDRPSVVRGGGSQRLCLTPEAPTKEVAIIEWPVEPPWPHDLPTRPVTVGGVAGERAGGQLPDGRYAGWIRLPSRDVQLVVRTRTEATTTRILDSLRLVDVDHVGCPDHRPKVVPQAVPGDGLVPDAPASVAICAYGGWRSDQLRASARLDGADAVRLAEAVNAARPGRNPNAPKDQCMQVDPPVPEYVLRVRTPDGRSGWLWITAEHCEGRGLDNGVRQGQLTRGLLALVAEPLHTGYSASGDLPQ